MSLVQDALRQKKETRRHETALRAAAMQKARSTMTAEARLSALLDIVAKAFEDPMVKELTFEVEETSVSIISSAIFEGKFAEYEATLNGTQLVITPQVIAL